MAYIQIEPTTTAHWHDLVQDAQQLCNLTLHDDLKSYLTFLLMRFTHNPEWINSVLAIDYLESFHESPRVRHHKLRNVGDQCLLLTGFYPEQAEKKNVTVKYFVRIGRGAYSAMSANSTLFHSLSDQFLKLIDVLQAIRYMGKKTMEPNLALEIWQTTQSDLALKQFKEATSDAEKIIILGSNNSPRLKH